MVCLPTFLRKEERTTNFQTMSFCYLKKSKKAFQGLENPQNSSEMIRIFRENHNYCDPIIENKIINQYYNPG